MADFIDTEAARAILDSKIENVPLFSEDEENEGVDHD